MFARRFALVSFVSVVLAACLDGSDPSDAFSSSSSSASSSASSSSGTGDSSSSSSSTSSSSTSGAPELCDDVVSWGCKQYIVWPMSKWEPGPRACYCMCFAQEDCKDAPFDAECGIAIKETGGVKVFPNGWPFVCVPVPTCSDGIENQFETGIDCGGDKAFGGCEPCANGQSCDESFDCETMNCNYSNPNGPHPGTCEP